MLKDFHVKRISKYVAAPANLSKKTETLALVFSCDFCEL